MTVKTKHTSSLVVHPHISSPPPLPVIMAKLRRCIDERRSDEGGGKKAVNNDQGSKNQTKIKTTPQRAKELNITGPLTPRPELLTQQKLTLNGVSKEKIWTRTLKKLCRRRRLSPITSWFFSSALFLFWKLSERRTVQFSHRVVPEKSSFLIPD